MASNLIILPSSMDRQPERGAGLDAMGPPRDGTSEYYCRTSFHPADKPRRFDAPPWNKGTEEEPVMVPPVPTVCPACHRILRERRAEAAAAEVRDGNCKIRRARATSGCPPLTFLLRGGGRIR